METKIDDLQPAANWGVVARPRRIADFKRALLPTLTAVGPILAGFLFFATGILRSLGDHEAEGLKALAVILAVPSSLWAMWNWSVAWNSAGDEAVTRAEKAFSGWQDNVLLPFLESKYKVRIRKGRERWWTMHHFDVVHPERGTVRVKVFGIEFQNYYYPDVAFSDDCATPPVPFIAAEPGLVEIIPAKEMTFRPLEAAASGAAAQSSK